MTSGQDSVLDLDALRTREGALVFVDCSKGICLETKQSLRHAVALGQQPILVLTNVDICFLNLKLQGEEVYQTFSRIVEETNAVIKQLKSELIEDVEVSPIEGEPIEDVSPIEGTVIFFAGTWGFKLQDFAKIYNSRYGSDQSEMIRWLWGENFYDPSTKKWTTSPTGSATCQRGFVICIYDSIKKVVDNSIQNQKDKLRRMMGKLGHSGIILGSVKGKELFSSVMKIWLPAGQICEIFGEHPTSFDSDCLEDENAGVVGKSSKGHEYEGQDTRDGGNRPPQQQAPAYRRKQQICFCPAAFDFFT